MPISQDRLKHLLDAGLAREEDFTNLFLAIESALETCPDYKTLHDAILVELTIRKGIVKPDAILAQEKMHYALTHKDNDRRRLNIQRVRDQQRMDGVLNTKPRLSRHSYVSPFLEYKAREENDIPEKIDLTKHPEKPVPDFSTPVPLPKDYVQYLERTNQSPKPDLKAIQLPEDEENE